MTISQWTNEVQSYLESINSELQANEGAKNTYYGFYVWDSNIVYNPDILFIGINPGIGDGVADYLVKTDEEDRISYLDHFDENYNYPLAKETISLLEPIFSTTKDLKHFLLTKVAKTNLFYIRTENENGIKQTLLSLSKHKWNEFFQKSCYFTVELIKILKPRIVLFEGKSAYNNIVEGCYEEKNTWKGNFGHYSSKSDGIEYIGYSRLYSSINNKEAVSKILSEHINNR